MVFDPVKDIEEFHEKFEIAYRGPPRQLPEDISEFRTGFLFEEIEEYADAVDAGDLVKQLDSLVDLMYVAVGTSYLQGFDFREAWRRVHEANMKKVRAETAADSKRGSTYDVVKPEGWEPPDLTDLVSWDFNIVTFPCPICHFQVRAPEGQMPRPCSRYGDKCYWSENFRVEVATNPESRWYQDKRNFGWEMPRASSWKRLWGVRHIRYTWLSLKVNQHHMLWERTGLVPTGYDKWVLYGVLRGWERRK